MLVEHPQNHPGKGTVSALLAMGYTIVDKQASSYLLVPCPVGTFSNSSSQGAAGCTPCPPGMLSFMAIFFLHGPGFLSSSGF